MAGQLPSADAVLVYDDDHYYMGGVIAQLLADSGKAVTLVTPGPEVSCWTQNTMEQHRIEKALLDRGVTLIAKHTLSGVASDSVSFACNTTDRALSIEAPGLVMVTLRAPMSSLYFSLAGEAQEQIDELPFGLWRIGDCMVPNTIAAAVYDGHRAAREMDNRPDPDSVPFKREQTLLE